MPFTTVLMANTVLSYCYLAITGGTRATLHSSRATLCSYVRASIL